MMKSSLLLLMMALGLFWLSNFKQKNVNNTQVGAQTEIQESMETIAAQAPVQLSEAPHTALKQTAKKAKSLPVSLTEISSALKKIEACKKSQSCYPQSDPREYEFHLTSERVSVLKNLNKRVQREKIRDQRISQIGQKFLSDEGDDVKLQALKLMVSQGVHRGLIDPIFDEVLSGPHPRATSFAIKILSVIKYPADQDLIHQKLSQLLTHGGIYPALEVVKNLKPLLTPQSRPYFERALADIERQKISEQLYSALKEKLQI